MGDLALGEGPGGYRLDALEVYNWGTFHRAVWRFPWADGMPSSPERSGPASPPW